MRPNYAYCQNCRGTFPSLFLENLRKPRENSWFLKRTMVGKNGESTPRLIVWILKFPSCLAIISHPTGQTQQLEELVGPTYHVGSPPFSPGFQREATSKSTILGWPYPDTYPFGHVSKSHAGPYPQEHPNPHQIGSKMGGEFTYQPKWSPKTVFFRDASPPHSPKARARLYRRVLRRCAEPQLGGHFGGFKGGLEAAGARRHRAGLLRKRGKGGEDSAQRPCQTW